MLAAGISTETAAATDMAADDGRHPLSRLEDGNRRFVSGQLRHPRQGPGRRAALKKGQHPFAAILSCADSRVPPEIVFDQGLGDLFVVRAAGNVVDDIVLGSLEYAVEHLHLKLVMVMGHGGCGAVAAAVEGHYIPGHLSSIVKLIEPAVKIARHQKGNLIDNAIRVNARLMARNLRRESPILDKAVREHHLRIVPARYALSTGKVTRLRPFPTS